MYATVDQARAAGAVGSDDDVEEALARARTLIDRFTRYWWEPTEAILVARVGPDGFVPLPRKVLTVTSVLLDGTDVALPDTGYRVYSSALFGAPNGVQLATWGANVLVVGAEPWRGGWANLTGRTRLVHVEGEFGEEVLDPAIMAAAALLAAWISVGGDDALPASPDVDAEGNSLVIKRLPVMSVGVEPILRTTGLAAADRLLAPLLTAGPIQVS